MNTPVTGIDLVGRVIDGRFPLLEWVGTSGQALIYRTEANGPGSPGAAIRLIPADLEDEENQIGDWALAAALANPHLVRLFASGRTLIDNQEILYAVTELPEEALSQILPERPLTPAEAREMIDPVLDALSFLHENGLVHGQVRPSNILVVDNQLKLSIDSVQLAGRFAPPNPSPEIYHAPDSAIGPLAPASDIWSLGVTLVESLTRQTPAWDPSANADPEVAESVPQPFSEIARACLRRDPVRRATAGEIRAFLHSNVPLPQVEAANLTSQPEPQITPPQYELPDRPVQPPTSPDRSPRHRGSLFVAAAVVLALAFGALLVRSHWNAPSTPNPTQPQAPAALPAQPPAATAPAVQPPVASHPTASATLEKGQVAVQVLPDIPQKASQTIHGKVEAVIRVAVDGAGDVSDASFDSLGYSRYFANQALQASQKWKFKPPQVNGEPASSVWILRFQFLRNGASVTPIEVSP